MAVRIVFMGTPQFAVPILQSLIDALPLGGAHGETVGVVTQPDRPRGRGRKSQPSPVKALAEKHGLPVLEPSSLRHPEVLVGLQALRPDVIVVASFGQILPPAVLELPPFGCINVHASLLPRWRGAAPVAAAILAGDTVTGITVMKMDIGLDTGPILSQRPLVIDSDDTSESLTNRLAQLGADALRETLPDWLAGNIEPQPQDEVSATYAPRLAKEQGRVDWSMSAENIALQVRAFNPWPGAFTYWQDKLLRILRATVTTERAGGEAKESSAPTVLREPDGGSQRLAGGDLLPGTVFARLDGPAVVTGRGVLLLHEVQLAAKQPMAASDFARGARNFIGARLA